MPPRFRTFILSIFLFPYIIFITVLYALCYFPGLSCLDFRTFLAIPQQHCNICCRCDNTDDICAEPRDIEADLGICNICDRNKCIPCARDERHPDKLRPACLEHPYRDRKESEQGQALVRPCKISPEDIEPVSIALGKYKDHCNQYEDHCGKS